MKIRIVCATRVERAQFATDTLLGRSLALYPFPFVELRLFPTNSRGLPECYNTAIDEARADPATLLFVHDDVHLLDFFWPDRLLTGLRAAQVVGVVGCRRRRPGQVSWRYADDLRTPETTDNLSGAIAHGGAWPADAVSYYGPIGVAVQLLDGVLMAADSRALIAAGVRFDERFDFHFYDLDFCRECTRKGLAISTVPLPIVHGSGGNYRSPSWSRAREAYFAKWGD
jgi:GT2 family glycosyltransferase